MDVDWLAHSLDFERPEITELKEPGHELRGVLGQVSASGRGELLHSCCETHSLPLRRVVHAEVVTDLADNDLSGVEAHADQEALAPCPLQLLRVLAKLLLEPQSRVARAPRMVLVGNRRAEKRHDPVTGVLVDRTLETVNAIREDREEAIHDLVPLLGIELLGQVHRAFDVGEEHRHLLPLAF
jgi:hypothetical protein